MHTSSGWYHAPKWAQKLVGSLTILALVILSAAPLLAAPATAFATTQHPTPGTNPELAHSCGLDIALVVDVSQSISTSERNQMKSALVGFVNDLAPTPSMFSLTSFAKTATVNLAFTNNTTDTTNAINALSGATQSGTNFEDALLKAGSTFDPRLSNSNVIVFVSDGDPNRKGTSGTTATASQAEDAAVIEANLLKAGPNPSPVHIITLGVGNNLNAQNLKNLSSASDYYTAATFGDVGDSLSQIALDLCGGTVTVQKMIDSDGNPDTEAVAGAAGWHFNVGGHDVVTDENGKTPAVELSQGNYGVEENPVAGYTFAANPTCVDQHGNAVGGPGENGLSAVHVGPLDIISCTFTNVSNHGTLHVVKHIVGNNDASPSSFSFIVDEDDAVAFEADGSNDVDVHTGTHSVVEAGVNPNYTVSYSNSANESANCNNLDVGPNGDVTCTITNTYVPPVQQCDLNAAHSVVSDTSTTQNGNPSVALSFIHSGWTASIPGATWIWGEEPITDTTVDENETFTKTFNVVGSVNAPATLMVAADNSYTVTLNGTPECLDQNTSDEFNYTSAGQDTCTIPAADFISNGVNTLVFAVKNWALADSNAQSNPAGLLYKLSYNANECDTGATCVPDVNLLQNPSFEAPVVTNGAGWDIFASGVSGLQWLVSWLNPSGAPLVANAELQKNGLLGVTASNGSQWAELDSDWDGPSGSVSGEAGAVSLAQTIATVPGKTYKVSFDFMPRPDTDGSESKVEALHGATVGATVDASAGAGWTNHSYTFVASGSSETISFRDAGANNNSVGTLLDNTSVTCQADVTPPPTTAHIVATKVVCDNETDLPNWGAGAGPDIDADTAADWVDAHPGCHLESGWNFQWAPANAGNPGDNTEHADSPWTTFGPTVNGVASTDVTVGDASYVWAREELKSGYIPFTYGTGENQSDSDNESAEFYCNVDHLHYDNWDRVDNLIAGNTYYCVAFNSPVDNGGGDETSHSDLSVTKTVTKLVGENQVSVDGEGVDVGTTLTYTVTVHNDGPDSATNVAVDDVLPSGVTVVGSPLASQGSYDGSTWTVGTLADDASATLTITVTVNSDTEGSSIVNNASIGDSDSVDSNNENDSDSVSVTVNGGDNGGDDNGGDDNGGGGGDTPTPHIFGGGVIGGGGGAGGNGLVLGASCGLYMGQHLRFGSNKNNKEQVTKLQTFLNEQGFGPLPVTGFFGPLTEAAVKAFQQKYADQILTPWGLNAPTGLVYLLTLWKINHIECPDLIDDLPSSLVPWSANPNAQ